MDPATLSSLRSDDGLLVSAYVQRRPGAVSAEIADLMKPLRARAERLERPMAKALAADFDRIQKSGDVVESSSADWFAFFASDRDGIMIRLPEEGPLWEHASYGPRPYLRPLRARPSGLRGVLVVGDRARARLFWWDGRRMREHSRQFEADIGKSDFGGFQGYDERTVRSRAEEETARMLRDVGGTLLDRHVQRPLHFVAVAGHQESLSMLAPVLHPYLRQLPQVSFVVDPHTMTVPQLTDRLREETALLQRQKDDALANSVLAAVEGGEPSARGVGPVLQAANLRAIDTLVVAGPFSKEGVVCDQCGWVGRSGASCPVCESRVFEVADVIGPLVESVLGAGGTVDHLSHASPVDADGVIARLRFEPV